MDLESRARWVDFSRAKDEMFVHTDLQESPWYVVEADIKRHARVNMISHLLSTLPYERPALPTITLPPRPLGGGLRAPAPGPVHPGPGRRRPAARLIPAAGPIVGR